VLKIYVDEFAEAYDFYVVGYKAKPIPKGVVPMLLGNSICNESYLSSEIITTRLDAAFRRTNNGSNGTEGKSS